MAQIQVDIHTKPRFESLLGIHKYTIKGGQKNVYALEGTTLKSELLFINVTVTVVTVYTKILSNTSN